jgi:DNA-binding response OmpR family regulator
MGENGSLKLPRSPLSPRLGRLRYAEPGAPGRFPRVPSERSVCPRFSVLDIALPGLNGIEVAHRLCKTFPDTKVLFLTQEEEAEVVRAALNNGAKGYVLKLDAGRELLPAIEAALRGETFVSSRVRDKVLLGRRQSLFPTAGNRPSKSNRNSVSGIENSVWPQFKRTAIFGNMNTAGLSRLCRPPGK